MVGPTRGGADQRVHLLHPARGPARHGRHAGRRGPVRHHPDRGDEPVRPRAAGHDGHRGRRGRIPARTGARRPAGGTGPRRGGPPNSPGRMCPRPRSTASARSPIARTGRSTRLDWPPHWRIGRVCCAARVSATWPAARTRWRCGRRRARTSRSNRANCSGTTPPARNWSSSASTSIPRSRGAGSIPPCSPTPCWRAARRCGGRRPIPLPAWEDTEPHDHSAESSLGTA